MSKNKDIVWYLLAQLRTRVATKSTARALLGSPENVHIFRVWALGPEPSASATLTLEFFNSREPTATVAEWQKFSGVDDRT